MSLLKPLETSACPFRERPRTNERPHWVQPRLVAQVRFTEWTADGKLRHPVYLGLRDDKHAKDVQREAAPVRKATTDTAAPKRARMRSPSPSRPQGRSQTRRAAATSPLVDQLNELEASGRDGVVDLPDGDQLSVTNLAKIFWPKPKLTKGALFRYYVQAAPYILPAVQDRPLTMKRLPNGITAPPSTSIALLTRCRRTSAWKPSPATMCRRGSSAAI